MKSILVHLLAALIGTAVPAVASAQAASPYPSGPVKLIMPAPPGGTSDKLMRQIIGKIGEGLGQPLVLDYKPGASGMVADEFVVKSPPDGQVILLASAGITMNPVLLKGAMRYDLEKDLQPIVCMVRYAHMLIVPANSPFQTLQDLVAYGKANPGKLNYASAGSGGAPHVLAEVFLRAAGFTATHVAYKGGGPALLAVTSGEVNASIVGVSTGLQLVNAGRVRVLAVTDNARAKALPNVPTFAELGYNGLNAPWLGILAPKGTPEAIVQRINQEFVKAMRDPKVLEWMGAEALHLVGNSPREFATMLAEEIGSNAKLAKEVGIKPE
jgi:tripartite-type tricarboxylate transporter receptor subunit TctC